MWFSKRGRPPSNGGRRNGSLVDGWPGRVSMPRNLSSSTLKAALAWACLTGSPATIGPVPVVVVLPGFCCSDALPRSSRNGAMPAAPANDAAPSVLATPAIPAVAAGGTPAAPPASRTQSAFGGDLPLENSPPNAPPLPPPTPGSPATLPASFLAITPAVRTFAHVGAPSQAFTNASATFGAAAT